VQTTGELVTPTGAAIAVTAAETFGELPPMTVRAVGVGAGTRTHEDRPNILRVVIGDAVAPSDGATDVVVLEANIDDLVPELVPDVLEACLAAGALDAWTAPIQMKKSRPGVLLSVLARRDDETTLAEIVLRHSSTLGVRVRRQHRYELDRAIREVGVSGHTVRVKIGLLGGEVVNVAPEHDDCAAVAAAVGRPVKQIWAEALTAAIATVEGASDELTR
jgi:pyridinium-3,5-bisthiocarboxylic acid mononucleotide nickel chelatase